MIKSRRVTCVHGWGDGLCTNTVGTLEGQTTGGSSTNGLKVLISWTLEVSRNSFSTFQKMSETPQDVRFIQKGDLKVTVCHQYRIMPPCIFCGCGFASAVSSLKGVIVFSTSSCRCFESPKQCDLLQYWKHSVSLCVWENYSHRCIYRWKAEQWPPKMPAPLCPEFSGGRMLFSVCGGRSVGYPSGRKWPLTAASHTKANSKYIIGLNVEVY